MFTNKLKANMVFDNYVKLCEFIQDEPKKQKSNAYEAQQKRWKQFFTHKRIEKNKHSLKITKVYTMPTNKADERLGECIPYIEKALLHQIIKWHTIEIYTKNSLLRRLHMCNEAFTYLKQTYNRQKALSRHLNISMDVIEEYFLLNKNVLCSNLETALSQLASRNIIKWSFATIVCKIPTDITQQELRIQQNVNVDIFEDEEVSHYIEVYKDLEQTFTEAKPCELNDIVILEDKYMDEFNCKDKQELIKNGKWHIFKDKINKILKDKYGILFYFEGYRITLLIQRDKLIDCGETLVVNEYMKEKIMNNANNRHTMLMEHPEKRFQTNSVKALEKFERRVNKTYLSEYAVLTDYLIDCKNINFINEIKQVVADEKTNNQNKQEKF